MGVEVLDFPSTTESRRIAEEYGYDAFIVRRWLTLFGSEAIEIIRAFEEGVPKYVRLNTIKIDEDGLLKRLRSRGFELRKTEVPFCFEVTEEPYSIGATPEYLMGYYYVMEKSSCIPPLVLAPKPGETIVDMAASPGGKTTFISMLMKNRGAVIAVEPQKERLQALIDNIHRMGAINVAVLNVDGRKLPSMGIVADKVLLDAPCSGEGIIHKDPTRKKDRGAKDIYFCSTLQKELILAAFDCLKPGGIMVYSTCSLAPEENEYVVDFLLQKRNATVEEIEWGDEALDLPNLKKFEEVRKARRLYPHKHRCSGFFVARIRKIQ